MNSDKNNLNISLKTAVLFLVFNRTETTTLSFEKIRQAKPPRLYIAADGPRRGHEGEKEKVKKVRKIATRVDWPCEVKTLFRKENLGCKMGVSSAITWFFEHEEQGIIIEDDCLPNQDFFIFCEILLDRYSKDERVSVITGNNFQNGMWRGEEAYYFSRYPHCWGWATWRRSWKDYDGGIKFWPNWRNSQAWSNYMPDRVERAYWENFFDLVYSEQMDSWAFPWTASIWYKGGLTATPNVNLSSNIGFGEDSTHTANKKSKLSKIPTKVLGKITHPKKFEKNIDAEIHTFNTVFGGKNLRFPYNWIKFFYSVLIYIFPNIKRYLRKC
jgi:hypothetical protein